jgi:hypothetical protein
MLDRKKYLNRKNIMDALYFSIFIFLIIINYLMCHGCASYHIVDRNGHTLTTVEINRILLDYVNKKNNQTFVFNISIPD